MAALQPNNQFTTDVTGQAFTSRAANVYGCFDSETGIDYSATGAFYFANSGDESNSIMSYTDLNADFGQFDRDNMARYLTVGYINQANTILRDIYAKRMSDTDDSVHRVLMNNSC